LTKNLSNKLITQLSPFLPEKSAEQVVDWLIEYKVHLKISKPRKSKLGDYRPPFNGKGHRISVNGDLNPYAFLVTFTHEVAHLITYNEYEGKVKPHGREWKGNYGELMLEHLKKEVFPKDLEKALAMHLRNPAASSCVDPNLIKALRKHDSPQKKAIGLITVEEVAEGGYFQFPNDGRVFQKGRLMRSRYQCLEINSGRKFAVNKMAEVFGVNIKGLNKF